MAGKSTVEADVRIKIYKDLNKGIIKFYKEALPHFNLGPYIKFWRKSDRLYLYTSTPSQGMLLGDKDTIQFSKPEYLAELTRFQGMFKLKCDDVKTHMYYIDASCKVGDVADEPTKRKPRKAKEVKEKFDNPLSPAKEALEDIVTIKQQKGTLEEFVKASEQPVKQTEKSNTAENIVIDTLRDLSDECLDNDDLAGAKALLKAIRKFKDMRGGETV